MWQWLAQEVQVTRENGIVASFTGPARERSADAPA
jgi:hypothetical protein